MSVIRARSVLVQNLYKIAGSGIWPVPAFFYNIKENFLQTIIIIVISRQVMFSLSSVMRAGQNCTILSFNATAASRFYHGWSLSASSC
jgi:hypothetical protein